MLIYVLFGLLFFSSIQGNSAEIPDINEDNLFRRQVIEAWLAGHTTFHYQKNQHQLDFRITKNRNDVDIYFANRYSFYDKMPIAQLLTEQAFYLFLAESPQSRTHMVCMYKDYLLSREKRLIPQENVRASHDCTPFEITLELVSPLPPSPRTRESSNGGRNNGNLGAKQNVEELLQAMVLVHARNYPIGPIITPKAVNYIHTNKGSFAYSFTDEETTDVRPTLHFSSFQAAKPHERGNWEHMDFALITRASRFKGKIWGGVSQDIITVGPYTISPDDIIVVESQRQEEFKQVSPSFSGKLIVFDKTKTSLRAAVQEGVDFMGAPRVMENVVGGPVLVKGKNIDHALFFKPLIEQGFVYGMHGNSIFYKIEGALRNMGSDLSFFHHAEKTCKELLTSFSRKKSIHELVMFKEAYFFYKKELLQQTKNLDDDARAYLQAWYSKNEEWLKLIDVEIQLGLQDQPHSLFTNTALLKEAMKSKNDPELLKQVVQRIKDYSVPSIAREPFGQKIFYPTSMYDDTLPDIAHVFLALPYDDFVQALKNIQAYNYDSDNLILSCMVARLAMMYKVRKFSFDPQELDNLDIPQKMRNFEEVQSLLKGENKNFPAVKKFLDFPEEIRDTIIGLIYPLSEYSLNKPILNVYNLKREVWNLFKPYNN